ncbi:signal peptidase II [Dietzia maris]|uniref:signal peptidase II n=1 Tax=Dietzia maris TaxID=37915 RepID=UPI0037CBCC80
MPKDVNPVTEPPHQSEQGALARTALVVSVVLLAAADLGAKTWAGGALADGHTVDLGLMQLRLGFNSGVAFSLGDGLPAGVVLAITGLIIGALAIFAWRATRTATRTVRLALALILGGAVANFIDRATDGVVTDYLHTGWFPTFNLADVFITGGAVVLIVATLTGRDKAEALEMPAASARQARGPHDH